MTDEKLIASVSFCCEKVNSTCDSLPARLHGMQMNVRSTLIHELFVGFMEESGHSGGKKNSKPDLMFGSVWLEVKASGKDDWQRHPVVGQLPLPPGNLHLLWATGPTLRLMCAYVIEDAVWCSGSSRNGQFERLDVPSYCRLKRIWGAQYDPKDSKRVSAIKRNPRDLAHAGSLDPGLDVGDDVVPAGDQNAASAEQG